MNTGRAISLEVETRRSGVDFRNRAADGPYLRISGSLWQLPARAAAAKPKFVDGKPTFSEAEDTFPACDAMLELTPEVDVQTCPTCGTQKTRFDALEQGEWLMAALTAAAEALRAKYDLSDEQLSDLLALGTGAAEWLVQIDRWAKGEDTTPPAPVPMWQSFPGLDDIPLPAMPKLTFKQRLGRWISGHG